MKHLSVRVAWHDNKWNGTVCCHPNLNTFCTHLPRIYEEKNSEEQKIKGKEWADLSEKELPPCKSESGGFMNKKEYKRTFKHPYSKDKELPHGNLLETTFELPKFSTFAVPFWWMLKTNQKWIDENYPNMSVDEKAKFNTPWVYSNHRQRDLLNLFFDEIEEKKSLIVFYTKNGNPIDEEAGRLIVGIGQIVKKSSMLEYESQSDITYPLWDRLITHSIREDLNESEGILIPYHEYLNLPEDFKLKIKDGYKDKNTLLSEIKVALSDVGTSETLIDTLSYGSKWVDNITMLGLLARFRVIIERIKEHGIVTGNWDKQLNWINTQIGKVKELMGPFPSFGSALVSIGFKYGHLFEHDIRSKGICGIKDDPWYYFDQYVNANLSLGETPYSADSPTFKITWKSFPDKTKELLRMLSRMELTAQQIKLWQDEASRLSAGYKIKDEELIGNPYVMAEDDEGDKEHYPVSIEAVDLALFKDKAIQGDCIPEQPYLVESEIDPRRIRAIMISILKQASKNGDTLLSIEDINQRFGTVKLQRPVEVPPQYIIAHIEFMKEKMVYFHDTAIPALQLKKYSEIETYLSKIFTARAKKEIDYISEDWDTYIKQTVDGFEDNNVRHKAALKDQKNALTRLTSRKLTVLHGAAGTGKTTVMGALFKSATLREEGVLLLAPTGKARVRLSNMAQSSAFTIAQFLNKQGRFDWSKMKVKFDGKSKYKAEQNIIIDECSMLTVEDFYALFNSLDLAHVKRIILVGDPFQLPPIGAGRPFADLCNYLETCTDQSDTSPKFALAKLEEVVRTRTTGDSDTLTLASWFTGSKPKKNADEIFSRIGNKEKLNDLEFRCWNTPDDLERLVLDALVDVLKLDDDKDYVKFNNSLGIESIKANPEKVESHQILTPVRNPVWGSFALNRLIQAHFRRTRASLKVGEQKMKQNDKVIQLTNEKRKSYPSNEEEQLSNGQIGIIEWINGMYVNVVFSGLPQKTFGYQSSGAEDDSAPIELAYAITVHKSQGSDFSKVFLIIPKSGKIMSRELIYTALTRAKDRLVVLIEGNSPHSIIELSKPQYSNTAVRNTQLFYYSVRETTSSIPFVEGLIHKTLKDGLIVRSKSEVIIANMLYERNVEFEYEREFKGKNGQRRIPDFTFIDAAGEIVILEHLGMLSKPAYRLEWEKKLKFYNENGFNLDENLFITSDDESGAINSLEIEKVIEMIMAVV